MKAETKKQEPGTIRRRSSYNRSLRKDNRQLFSMCVPGIILLALFAYLPMFGLVLAFKNYKFNLGIFGSEWVGFKNFEFFFTSGTFGRLIRNTLGLNLLFLLCNTVITVLLALLLYEINSRHAIKAFQTVIFLPFIVSWVAASYALYANLADVNGIVNGILTFFGKETVSWYTTPKWWPYILLVCYLWKNMGYGIIIYYGNLLSIDKSYFEAAAARRRNALAGHVEDLVSVHPSNRDHVLYFVAWPDFQRRLRYVLLSDKELQYALQCDGRDRHVCLPRTARDRRRGHVHGHRPVSVGCRLYHSGRSK